MLLLWGCYNTQPPAPWDGGAGTAGKGPGGAAAGGAGGSQAGGSQAAGSEGGAAPGGAAGESAVGGSGSGVDCETGFLDPERREQPGSSLAEVSGLAVAADGRLLFALNDSGNRAALYGVTLEGELSGVWSAPADESQITLVDWEDLAPDHSRPGEPRLVIADIGDNDTTRTELVLYSVDEPTPAAGGELVLRQTIRFSYEDGPRNAETLLVDERSRDFVIVSKEASPGIYVGRMPESDGVFTVRLALSGTLSEEVTAFVPTGGSVAPGGDAVLLRSRDRMLLFPRGPGRTLAEALGEPPCEVPLAEEPQGEAVAFDPDGSYFTVGEGPSPLYFYERVAE